MVSGHSNSPRVAASTVHVGDALVERLLEYGVATVFGCPGGQTLPLYNAIAKSQGRLTHVLMRDERAAVFAADAFARATGRIGVCDATVGPGATNLVSGLAEARMASIPVLAIVSDIPRGWEQHRRYAAASQAFDQRAVLEPAVKWYGRVQTASDLHSTLDACLRIATGGRPGPVVLEIPDDVFAGNAHEIAAGTAGDGTHVDKRWATYPRLRAGADAESIQEAATVLSGATRPLIIAGGGALYADAGEVLLDLAEELGALVATTITAKGLVAENHRRSIGVVGRFGIPAANEFYQQSDGVLFVGSKIGQSTTLNWNLPRANVPVVQVDVDAEEIGRSFPDTVGIVADARNGCLALRDELATRDCVSAWDLDHVAAVMNDWWTAPITYASAPVPGVVKPQDVVRVVSRHLGPADSLACDASLSSGWGATYWQAVSPGRRFFAPRGLAGLGWGLPGAIGVATARKSEGTGHVVCLAGDGGWAYSMSEIETAVRQGLPIVAVVLNNSTLGWIKHTAEARYGDEYVSSRFTDVRYSDAALALGATASFVDSVESFEAAFEKAIGSANLQSVHVIEVRSCADESPIVPIPKATATAGGY